MIPTGSGRRAAAQSPLAAFAARQSFFLRIRWVNGQNSALDTGDVAKGRDVGTVVVERRAGDQWEVVPYEVPFAFAFKAFHPDGVIRTG
jgi:hypothetical protein